MVGRRPSQPLAPTVEVFDNKIIIDWFLNDHVGADQLEVEDYQI